MVLYLALAPGDPGLAVVAGRRVGRAVARNRARRILREAWRILASRLPGDYRAVLVARPAIQGAKTGQVVDEIVESLGEVKG